MQNSNKTIWIALLLLVAAVAIGGWYFTLKANRGKELLEATTAPETVSNEIQEELNSIDLGNLDADIQNLDADINQL